MLAQKENKTYRITEAEKKMYLADGYDIYGDEGELVERSPSTTVSWEVHSKALARIKELEAEFSEKKGAEPEQDDAKPEQSKGSKSKKAD